MRFLPIPTPPNPLGLVIKLLTCALLSLTISREIREIQREKREAADKKETGHGQG